MFEAIIYNVDPMQSNPVAFVTSILDKLLLMNDLFTNGMVNFVSSIN